jgi:hypothetical protein
VQAVVLKMLVDRHFGKGVENPGNLHLRAIVALPARVSCRLPGAEPLY